MPAPPDSVLSGGDDSGGGDGSTEKVLGGISISRKLTLVYGVLHGLLAIAIIIGITTSWVTFRNSRRDPPRRSFQLLLIALNLGVVGLILGSVVYCTGAATPAFLGSITFIRLAHLSASFNTLSWAIGVACVADTACSVYYCATGKKSLKLISGIMLATGGIMALIVLVLLGWWQAYYTNASYVDNDLRSRKEYWNTSRPFRTLGSFFTLIGYGTSLIFIRLAIMTVRAAKATATTDAATTAGRVPSWDIPDNILASLIKVTIWIRYLLANNLLAWGIGLVNVTYHLRDQSPGTVWSTASFIAELLLQYSVLSWVLVIGRHTTSGMPTISQRWRVDCLHRPLEQEFMSERGRDL